LIVEVLMPGPLFVNDDRARLYGDRDHGDDPGLLGGVERIVEQLFEDDARPILDRVPGLIDQLPDRAELHQPRDAEGDPG
jgi:hypothetical protein